MNKAVLPILLLAGALNACGGGSTQNAALTDEPANTPTPPVVASTAVRSELPRDTAPQASESDVNAIVAGNADFALKALARFDTGGDANIVFSPYSISQALALAAAGAKGDTLAGIEQALSFQLPQNRFMPAMNKVDLLLAAKTAGAVQSSVETPNLNVVNTVWGQRNFPLLSTYLDALSLNYGAGLRVLDFVNAPEQARVTINDWVEDQTNKKIKDLLAEGVVTTDTRLVLTNAVWFKGAWASPFRTDATDSQTFFSRSGATANVPFMNQTARFAYAEGAGYQAVDIPYSGNQLSMLVVMPAAGSFDTFMRGLTPSGLSEIVSSLSVRSITLSLPKFTFSSTPDIGKELQGMGMTDAFNPIRADFSGMNGKRDLSVSEIAHKAFVSVDEHGTEAAAATAVLATTVSSITEPEPTVRLTVNRPFLFLIRDRQTGLAVFIGKVILPS